MKELVNYLQLEDWEKGAELASAYGWKFVEWVKEEGYESVIPDWEDIESEESVPNALAYPKGLLEEFYAEMESDFEILQDAGSPSFLHMTYWKAFKGWVLHFTSDSESVACRGFERGVEDYTMLGLTTLLPDSFKGKDGYNFAYDAFDWERFASGRHGFRYGEEVVLAQVDGIIVEHYGDQEDQVIFKGKEAKNLVWIKKYDGGWWIKGEIGEDGGDEDGFSNLGDAVDYVTSNFDVDMLC